MSQRRRVRVVGLVGVGEHAVGQRGINRGRNNVAADYARFFDAAEGLHVSGRFFARREARPGNHRGHCIEDVVLGFFDHR